MFDSDAVTLIVYVPILSALLVYAVNCLRLPSKEMNKGNASPLLKVAEYVAIVTSVHERSVVKALKVNYSSEFDI